MATGLQSSYDAMKSDDQIDENTLYFCTDTNRLFLGQDEYTRPIIVGSSVPDSAEPPYSLYFNNGNGSSGGILYYSDGTSWHEIYNLSTITNYLNRRIEFFRGVCESSASTAVKAVQCADFLAADFQVGTLIAITFTNTNSANPNNLKFLINNMSKAANNAGDPVRKQMNSSTVTLTAANEFQPNKTYLFAFDGTNWVCLTLNNNNNNKVAQNISSDNSNHPLLMSYYANGSATTTAQVAYRNDKISANPSTGTLYANTFSGSLGHSLTIGTYVFDGHEDIEVPVYDGTIEIEEDDSGSGERGDGGSGR